MIDFGLNLQEAGDALRIVIADLRSIDEVATDEVH